MQERKIYWLFLLLFTMSVHVGGQEKKIHYEYVEPSEVFIDTVLLPRTTLLSQEKFAQYLVDSMSNHGYPYFSIDSIYGNEKAYTVSIYQGSKVSSVSIHYQLDSVARKLLTMDTLYTTQSDQTQSLLDSIGGLGIQKLTEVGYILANIGMDSFVHDRENLNIYNHIKSYYKLKIDSIRQQGKLEINYTLLYKLSGLTGQEYFYPYVLDQVEKNLKAYEFIRIKSPPQIDIYDEEVDIILDLDNRNTNQADIVIGFQPNDTETGKLLITGKADLKLINSFSRAESIRVSWQQLQVLSPRLDASFSLPYIANSNFGMSLNLNYFKKDSAFRTLHTGISADYTFSPNHLFSLYFQTDDSRIITLDTQKILLNDFRLDFIDYVKRSYGMRYLRSKMDRRLNPRKGYQIILDLASRSRKVIENNELLELSNTAGLNYQDIFDSLSNDRWQSSLELHLDKLSPLSRQFVWKNSLKAQYLLANSLFKNEMIQIGGFQTLRGYDEQSLFVKNYSLWLTELRYLLGANGFLSTFVNMAYIDRYYSTGNQYEFKTGFGAGLSVFTNSGNFSIQYALGTNDQNKVELSNGKIHLGYISNF